MNIKSMTALTLGVLVFSATQAQAQWQVHVSYGDALSCSRMVAGLQPVATVGNFAAWFPTPVGSTLLAPLSALLPALPSQTWVSLLSGYLRDQVRSTQSQSGYFTTDISVQWVGQAPAPAKAQLRLELWANKTRMALPNWNGNDAVAQLSLVTLTNTDTLMSVQNSASAPNFVVGGPANQFSTAQRFLTLPLENGSGHYRVTGKQSLYMRFQGVNGSVGACETRLNLGIF